MGYTRKSKIYKLRFEGTEQDGLEVRVRGLTVGQLNGMADDEAEDTAAARRRMRQLLADQLIDWNMEDEDGNPLPCTMASIDTLDPLELAAIINAWTSAITQVSGPLPQTSDGGPPSEVGQIPMEPLSESLAS